MGFKKAKDMHRPTLVSIRIRMITSRILTAELWNGCTGVTEFSLYIIDYYMNDENIAL